MNRRDARRLPLALSLVLHGCALAVLWHFAPLAPAVERDAEPVTVRLVPHSTGRELALEPVRSCNRSALPPEPESAPVEIEPQSLEELFAELPDAGQADLGEIPLSAPHSTIGVGSSGALLCARLHARAVESSGEPAPSAAPAAGATTTVPLACLAPADPTPPTPLECPPPEYPAGAAAVGERGRVQLEIRIGADGRVESVAVLRSSGYARLDEAARLGVLRWRFHPAQRDGSAIPWRLEHSIVFRVENARS